MDPVGEMMQSQQPGAEIKHHLDDGLHWLFQRFGSFAQQVALVFRGEKYTYGMLLEEITEALDCLKSNSVSAGEVVAILSDFSPNSIAFFLALMVNRNILVPINVSDLAELEIKLLEAQVDMVITLPEHLPPDIKKRVSGPKHLLIQELQKSSNAGLILFSSGSTGKPKAMLHHLDQLVEAYRDKKPKSLNILMFLLFDHIGGIDSLFRALSIGATLTIPENRDPLYIAQLIESQQVTVLPASPSFLSLFLLSQANQQYELSSLRIIGYGAEPMPETLLTKLKAAFPHVSLQQKFGTSETNAVKITSESSDSLYFKFDDPNVEYQIIEGELWLKSKSQVLGYLNYETKDFTEDQWFRTGDLVETIEDGYLRIIGRLNDLINVGGQKVFPIEVENVLLEMPEVADCLVYGESNPLLGQIVVADIVVNTASETHEDLKKQIRQACKTQLEAYKIPSKIKIVDGIQTGNRLKRVRTPHG
jgi:acyl-CoA synthetase (AMP-forming)/AMP-acid ligase II